MKNIAIDGPAGSGKTTISKILSKELNLNYIDTGAMYRCVAFYLLQNNLDLNIDFSTIKDKINISFDETKIILNNTNVSDYIRTNEISQVASIISKNKEIRDFLGTQQKEFAKNSEIIMEGRDITTVILVDSPCKIYLDASIGERTMRRLKQNNSSLLEFPTLLKELTERDDRDMNRTEAPLMISKDALYIDSTYLTIDEVKQIIISKWNTLL